MPILEPDAILPPEIRALSSLVADPSRYLPVDVRYARVHSPMPVYDSLEDVPAGRVREHHGGQGVWVSVLDRAVVGGESYHRVRWAWARMGWMADGALSFEAALSGLRGVDLRFDARLLELGMDPSAPLEHPLAMVYASALNVRSEPGVLEEETQVGRLERYDLVSIFEARRINETLWYRIGEGQWLHSGYVRTFSPRARPEGVGEGEKWIDVNLSEQTVIAMEGDKPVYAALAATGRVGFETVTGLHRIWIKLRSAPMQGVNLAYSYADMPWVMYFSGSYGIHGVYHHDSFGTARSAGCVNLSVYDAKWFFSWTGPSLAPGERQRRSDEDEPGTWVYVSS